MKLFYMILASLITVLMASYALWLIAHIDMPLPKRLVQLFPPLLVVGFFVTYLIRTPTACSKTSKHQKFALP